MRALFLPAFLAALLTLLGPAQAQSVNARNMLKLARSHAVAGEWERAKEYANKALAEEPGYVDAMYMRAFAHRELKEYDKAEKDFKEVIQVSPDYLPTYGGLAEVYLRQKQYDKADAIFVELSAQPHGSKWASYYRGVVAYLQQDLDKAEKLWKSTISEDTNFAAAHHNLGALYLAKGDSLRALTKFREALDKKPETALYLFHIAWAQERLNQKEEAQRTLATVLNEHVEDQQFWLLATGLKRLLDGNPASAVQVLDTVAESHADNLDVWVLLGRAHLALKQPDKARKALETAKELDGAFVEVDALLAKLPAKAPEKVEETAPEKAESEDPTVEQSPPEEPATEAQPEDPPAEAEPQVEEPEPQPEEPEPESETEESKS
jgi:tetratricopeptide (TPR) repeat protein